MANLCTTRRLQLEHADRLAPDLTRIALLAKRHWGYPEAWIQEWTPQLTFTGDDIRRHPTWGAFDGPSLVGFTTLQVAPAEAAPGTEQVASLEHMWLAPTHHGLGLGRRLFEALKSHAIESVVTELEVVSDPYAEGFYRKLGFLPHSTFSTTVAGEPRSLPVLRLALG